MRKPVAIRTIYYNLKNRNSTFLLFLLAILTGIGMRFYGLSWGLPYHFHSDEHILAYFTEKLRTAESIQQLTHQEIRFFLYPPFLMYLLISLITLASFFHSFSLTDPRSLTLYYLLGRGIAASFGSITLIAVYLLGKQLYTQSVGILAAVFLAFSVLHVRDSHFYFPDVPFTFFLVLTVFFAARFIEKHRLKYYVLAGIFTGVGMATKQTALMVLPVILTAYLIERFQHLRSWAAYKKVLFSISFWGFVLFPIFLAGITFLLLNPFVLINFEKFQEMSHKTAQFVKGTNQPQWTFQFTDTTFLYWFTNLLYFGMGPLLEAVCMAGMIWAFVKRKIPDLLLLSFLLPYFYFIGGGYMKFIRYAIPLLPFLCLLGARFLLDLLKITRHHIERVAVKVVITLVIITSLLYSLAYLNIYRQEDVRIQASRWIHQHIPPGSTVLIDTSSSTPLLGSMFFYPEFYTSYIVDEAHLHFVKKDYFTIKVINLITDSRQALHSPGWWQHYLQERLEKVDFIIFSDECYEQYSHRQSSYPTLNQFYQDLFSGRLGYRLLKTFKTYPSLFGYTLKDDRAELTFRLFDHPKIMIFKRAELSEMTQGLLNRFDPETSFQALEVQKIL
ncbi:MAG TPA: glycosyltransferase family 39 protein [Candidatus Limnocylindrales bacterium]|nr:glycosyltransferase family 39 protein [Candidatus Limnocylindrales bacterium]